METSSRRSAALGCMLLAVGGVSSFAPVVASTFHGTTRNSQSIILFANMPDNPDSVSNQISKAKELLAKAKLKLEAREKASSESENQVPFFAAQNAPSTRTDSVSKRDQVTKSKNDATGLITTDGEKMAAMSEQEQWENRSLGEVFENETKAREFKSGHVERDVAMSIFNLRRSMKNEDYKRIFDSKNYLIGEDS
eukprot:scaffold50805_cov45-Attheya_sp.AAC.2